MLTEISGGGCIVLPEMEKLPYIFILMTAFPMVYLQSTNDGLFPERV